MKANNKSGTVKALSLILAAATLLFPLLFAQADNSSAGRSQDQNQNQQDQNQNHGQEKHMKVCSQPSADQAGCTAHVITDQKGNVHTSVVPSGNGPAVFHTAYNLPTTTASKQIIGIVDAYHDPNAYNDLTYYSNYYHIPVLPKCNAAVGSATNSPCFSQVNQNGYTFSYPQTNSGWALEISLDIEAAHAVCQNCSIVLVEAGNSSFGNLLTAEDRAAALGAKYISNSWDGSEFSGETSSTYDSHFNKPGVAITVSSGDSGYGVEYPASSQYVTAVGGTSLLASASSSTGYIETAWSGSGSGCSAFEPQKSWQTALGLSGCSKRMVADVSADADPYTGAAVYDTVSYYGTSGWFQVGGTSLSSPLVAATYALAGNVTTATPANQQPYLFHSGLNDVISGSNGSCSPSFLCTSRTGYDGPTGLGSPNGLTSF